MLFMDYNTERSVVAIAKQEKYKMDKTVMKMPGHERKNSVEVDLPALAHYSAYEPGSYKMSALGPQCSGKRG